MRQDGCRFLCRRKRRTRPRQLGEIWLRGKVATHTADEFHRVDSPLLRAAVVDILRELDTLRGAS